MQIFLTDLGEKNEPTGHAVTYEPTDQGTYLVRGLPLMRTGTWNGREFSASELKRMAANFSVMQRREKFEPGLWPKHNYDHKGNVVPQDANHAMGFYTSLRFDEPSKTLLGDVEVYEEQTAADMKRRKLRYISAEIENRDGLGPTVMGAAFVPDPAVKGMPWHMVINSADYAQNDQDAEKRAGSGLQTIRGGRPMKTLVGKLKEMFSAARDGDTEALDEGIKALEELEVEDEPKPDPDPDDKDAAAGEGDDADRDMLARQIRQLEKSNAELKERVVLQEQAAEKSAREARMGKAEAKVDEWVGSGHIPPAMRNQALVLAANAVEAQEPVMILSADGKSKDKLPLIDVLSDVLKASAPPVGGSQGLVWAGSEDPNEEPAMSDEQLAELAKNA